MLSLGVVATLAAQVAAERGFQDIATGIALAAVALSSAVLAASWPEAPHPPARQARGMRGVAG
jgi:hypothetical protein